MLVFAYDGSLNGDWVAHYAVRFAANAAEKRLRLVLVHSGPPEAHVAARITRIADECRLFGVALEAELHASGNVGIAEKLLALVPAGPRTTVICGTRARPRNGAYFGGTVAARLLQARGLSVVAIRVVHTGALGQPGRVLLPLAGHHDSAAGAAWLLRMLGADLHELHILHVHAVSTLRFRTLSPDGARRLARGGRTFVSGAETELRAKLAMSHLKLDSCVVVSDDVPREILNAAAKQRVRLIGLGASRRALPARLMRGDLIEKILIETTADVAVYRSAD